MLEESNLSILNMLVCLAATLYMTGVIWVVQIAHYPLFALVGEAAFPAYHAAHERQITLVVLLPMLVEAGTTVALLLLRPASIPAWVAWLGLILLGIVWATTFFLSVPYHSVLERASEPARGAAIAGLVATNWLRTLAWSARSLLLLYALYVTLAVARFR